jgi:hypothetical protein
LAVAIPAASAFTRARIGVQLASVHSIFDLSAIIYLEVTSLECSARSIQFHLPDRRPTHLAPRLLFCIASLASILRSDTPTAALLSSRLLSNRPMRYVLTKCAAAITLPSSAVAAQRRSMARRATSDILVWLSAARSCSLQRIWSSLSPSVTAEHQPRFSPLVILSCQAAVTARSSALLLDHSPSFSFKASSRRKAVSSSVRERSKVYIAGRTSLAASHLLN